MEKNKVDRINELAKKAKEADLTEEEKVERQALREEYINEHKNSLKAQLENVIIVDEKGNRTKIKKKDEK